ncbi:leucine-rich repeat transmembrane neuronal protein 1-like [Mustela putorius furo]|uniref:Leucine-rich repeat transmembrane neuronal protein 1-like n=1 Tax=Mustela putorius furo TaxID=9669 RepID=A0A8U0RJ23_MUSPF|nr:leucine-rich repeat transmembrane neuronal protein 1-like [Mustela putorius furo]
MEHVFEILLHLQTLQLDSSCLTYIEPWILNSWKSLMSIILARNIWDCGCIVCGLASWLHSFQGHCDDNSQCASPDYTQGKDILDAVDTFHLCEDRAKSTVGLLLSTIPTTVTWSSRLVQPPCLLMAGRGSSVAHTSQLLWLSPAVSMLRTR